MLNRSTLLGDDAGDDRFELLWHQTALGVAQGVQQWDLQQEYLDAIRGRFEQARQRGVWADSRIPLARAIAAAGLCCARSAPGEPVQWVRFSSRPPATTFQAAMALFEEAARVPALRVEALIRGGMLLRATGHDAEALAWFGQVPDDDRSFGYVHHLTRGRILDALHRPAEAVAAYEAALRDAPTAQLAGIGLAAALLRSGRAEAAARTAMEVRRAPGGPTNHFREFQRADVRFVPEWLAEIRRLRR
jgi:tetratricopeptide (TPR) repeat protein